MKNKLFLAFLLTVFIFQDVFSGNKDSRMAKPALIPSPQLITWNNQVFIIRGNETRIVKKLTDKLLGIKGNSQEAYTLKITADSVVLLAETETGLFYGEQTLNQLKTEKDGKLVFAGCAVTDWPAFQVRGFMQDVGRNFMSLPMLKEQLDVMAAYKLNVFHFHVTDNPGWRLESKIYPQLNAASSMSRWSGKFYSQAEFLELAEYCHTKHITLIPEFDIPGHCAAFRRAFSLDSMSDKRIKPILINLIDELCSLLPKEQMPYIHLGTDEVWSAHEKPEPGLLEAIMERVKHNGREVIVWRPGQQVGSDHTSITQLWSSNGKPKEGHRYIDSRLNYLNHLDPLAGVAQLFFNRVCNAQAGDSIRLGGILCCWNDNNVNEEYDILRHNPVYPGMLTYSETSWKGQPVDFGEKFSAKLPSPDDPLFEQFREFENRLVEHRNRFFEGKPFPYIKQTAISWVLYGPVGKEEEAEFEKAVGEGNKTKWKKSGVRKTGPVYGGTIHVRHQFGYPSWISDKEGTVFATTYVWSPVTQEVGCWIGFNDWSRSGGRRGGPFPEQGMWHNTNPKVWLNQVLIPPPVWNNPGLAEKTEEIPFTDENYFFRKPTQILLKKGWNEVVMKVPHYKNSWKWMFTFVPVKITGDKIGEVEGLKFQAER